MVRIFFQRRGNADLDWSIDKFYAIEYEVCEFVIGPVCGEWAGVLTGTDHVWRGEPLHGREDQPVWDVHADGLDYLASAIYALRFFQTAQYPGRKSGIGMGRAAKKTAQRTK